MCNRRQKTLLKNYSIRVKRRKKDGLTKIKHVTLFRYCFFLGGGKRVLNRRNLSLLEHCTIVTIGTQYSASVKRDWGYTRVWDTEECPLSVLSGLILEKKYELFVGTNETVRYTGVRSAGLRCSRSSCGG